MALLKTLPRQKRKNIMISYYLQVLPLDQQYSITQSVSWLVVWYIIFLHWCWGFSLSTCFWTHQRVTSEFKSQSCPPCNSRRKTGRAPISGKPDYKFVKESGSLRLFLRGF